MNEPTILDLFSGIGGMSLGFEREGFRTIGFSEIDAFASAVLHKHWPVVRNFGDITGLCRRIHDCEYDEESGDSFCPRCQTEFGECACVGTDEFTDTVGFPTVITGGFPCQNISGNGAGEGLSGDKSKLWFEFARVIRELDPAFCLIENVPNLRTKGADTVLSDLERAGYTAQAFVVGAWAAGAEHTRDRIWIFAHNQSVRMEGLWSSGKQKPQPLDFPFLPLRDGDGLWQVEPDLRRAVDGVSGVMDRIKCVGNAVCPQIPQIFARAIKRIIAA